MRFRISVYLTAAFLAASSVTEGSVERLRVGHEYVRDLAAEIAAESYEPPASHVPRFFRQLDYDKYRLIRFRTERSLWRDDALPFQVQFFHPGYLHQQTVDLSEFTETHVQPIPFSNQLFDYQTLRVPFWSRRGLGYAGFRVLNELNGPGRWDELVSFLGASYFRALGQGQRYGISARGLAVNSGGPGEEEFPAFVEFWLGKPAADSRSITIHALLASPRVTGAYTFIVSPGDATVVDVRATLFFRGELQNVGFAPMSSMFWFGEASQNRFGDFRPEVHDSDGLLVATDADDRVWRPLSNPSEIQRTDLDAPALKGFGLLQRDRELRSYEDIEALYNLRPGLWIEPIGEWPAGRVRLVEIPTASEFADNIVAFWTPAEPFIPGEPVEIHWRLHWTTAPAFGGPPGWVRSTRQSLEGAAEGRTRYVVDFDGGSMADVAPDAAVGAEVASTTPASVVEHQVLRNEHDGSWRLLMTFSAPPGSQPCELSARLTVGGRAVTETWLTRWKP
ncbi:MAG TPA: glucan biosynthesis protein G [Opitutaceae bacterium]